LAKFQAKTDKKATWKGFQMALNNA
jgi:hypothetical protein